MDLSALNAFDGILRAGSLYVLRVAAALWLLPVFGQGPVAKFHKIGLALFLGVLAATSAGPLHLQDPGSDPFVFGLACVREILFGLLMGWMTGLIFEVSRMAGALVATEMGLHMSNLVDPISNINVPLLSHLFQSMVMILFFIADGHHLVMAALLQSFQEVPIGTFQFTEELGETLMGISGTLILTGLRMIAPVFLLLVVVTMCVGFLTKVAPQLHVLEASWPIRILAGFLLLILFLPSLTQTFDHLLETLGFELFKVARGGR